MESEREQLNDQLVDAVLRDNVEDAKNALSRGADVNSCIEDGYLLRMSAMNSNIDMINVILNVCHSSRVFIRKDAALIEAAKNNDMEIVKLLLSEYKLCYQQAMRISVRETLDKIFKARSESPVDWDQWYHDGEFVRKSLLNQ